MLDEVITFFNEHDDRAYTVEQVYDALGLKTTEDMQRLESSLRSLETKQTILCTKKNKYMLAPKAEYITGRMISNKNGYGFVDIPGDEDVFVAADNINGAIDGDSVSVLITSKRGTKLEGKIVKILERKLKEVVGEYVTIYNQGTVVPDDKSLNITIEVAKDHSMQAVDGHKVVVKLLNRISDNTFNGDITRIIGHKNDPGVDILSIGATYGFNPDFGPLVVEELKTVKDSVSKEECQGYVDLRNETIFTIDGDDTKDIDDGVSIKRLANGNYEVGVHIADVSHYVKENSPLDLAAYERGTSVYMGDTVMPMLPHQLSNGICSLNPGTDRLAQSCVMEMNEQGEILNHQLFRSVISSKKQMTYKHVNHLLEDNIIDPGYEAYESDLKLMNEAALCHRKMMLRRGYIDFSVSEIKPLFDQSGQLVDIKLRENGAGEKLIEDLMIMANETVANHMTDLGLPFAYRVHDTPNPIKVKKFINLLNEVGCKVGRKFNAYNPKNVQELLSSIQTRPDYPILADHILRSMQKAVYSSTNIGHYGLGSKCYCHFTSPIRRYPDLIVHRLLDTFVFDHNMSQIDEWTKKLPTILEHASTKERDAEASEREADDMYMAEYMQKHLGEHYNALISGVQSFGFFARLPNTIEGLVSIRTLGNYHFNERTLAISSKNDRRGYRLCDKVAVTVMKADKESREIDFNVDHKQSSLSAKKHQFHKHH